MEKGGLVRKRKGAVEWEGQERVMGMNVIKICYIHV